MPGCVRDGESVAEGWVHWVLPVFLKTACVHSKCTVVLAEVWVSACELNSWQWSCVELLGIIIVCFVYLLKYFYNVYFMFVIAEN